MKGLVAVARLELERRWTLLALAVSFSVLPFLIVPLLGAHESETQSIALVLALLLGSAAALLLGSTAIAGDLAGGRLGFYFSRPLSWWEIWGGKLAAAAGLTLASGLIVMLPALLVPRGGSTRVATLWDASGALYLTGLVFLALGVVQWGAVAARSRSAWLVLDVLALPLVAWGFADALLRIFRLGLHPDPWGYSLLVWPVALAWHAAGAAQAALGRTGIRRSHAVTSLTAWGLLAVIALGWQVASRTAFRPDPARLDRAWMREPAATGDVALVVGMPRVPGFGWHAWHSFLVTPSGIQLLEPMANVYHVAFSGDGTRAVAFTRREGMPPELLVRAIDGVNSTTREQRVRLPSDATPTRMIVDERGQRVALLWRDAATLYDLVTGEPEVTLPPAESGPVSYVVLNEAGPDRLFRRSEAGGLSIEDLSGGVVGPATEIAAPSQGEWRSFHVDAAGERLLALGEGAAALFATATGERLARFEEPPSARLFGLLLADGRVLIANPSTGATTLRLFDAAGTQQGELDLGPARLAFLTETTPGRVVAAVGDIPFFSSHLAVVGTDPLRVIRIEEHLDWTPSRDLIWGGGWRRDRPAGGTLLVTRLDSVREHRIQSSVLRYDVESGRQEWVAGAR